MATSIDFDQTSRRVPKVAKRPPRVDATTSARERTLANQRRSATMLKRAGDGVLTGRLAATLTDLEMAAMLHGGATLAEIGQQAGITRERVRQRLARIGVAPARRLDVRLILDKVRGDQRADSFTALARLTGAATSTVHRAIQELGMIEAVKRLFRLRVRARRRARLEGVAQALRAYGHTLGRTPRARDLWGGCRPRNIPALSTVRGLFGSLGKAQRAAGLEPNQRGRRPRKSE